MVELFRHEPLRGSFHPRRADLSALVDRLGAHLRAGWQAILRRLEALTAFVLVGASSLVGVDAFGALLWMWPLYPTAVPAILIGCALVYGAWRLLRGLRRRRRE